MGGWIDISNGEREWPANDGPPQRASRCSPPPPSLEGPSPPPPQLSPWLTHVSSPTQLPLIVTTFSAESPFRSLSVATTVASAEECFVAPVLPAPPLSSIPPASTFSFHPAMSPSLTTSRRSHVSWMRVSATIAMTKSTVCLPLPAIALASFPILFLLLLLVLTTAPSPLPLLPQLLLQPLHPLASLAPCLPLPFPLAPCPLAWLLLKNLMGSLMLILSVDQASSARPLAVADGSPSNKWFSVATVRLAARLLSRLSLSAKSKRPRSADLIPSSKMATFSIVFPLRSSQRMTLTGHHVSVLSPFPLSDALTRILIVWLVLVLRLYVILVRFL